jgi:hypothetical protein
MARTAALGDGPVAFFTEGVQVEVPLSAIYFENDAVRTTRTDLPGFDKWIAFLASRNRLVAGAAPPVAKAIVVTAAAPGAAGNDIQVTVSRKTDTTVDITVTETDKYEGLTLATLTSRLGNAAGETGTKPGLLHVKSFPTGSETLPVVAAANIPSTGTPPKWTIAGTGATAVTLEPRRSTGFNAGDRKTVSISNVSAPAAGATFTLTVTWTKAVADTTLADLPTALAQLGYLITADAPDSGFKLPRPGTVTLAGGREPVAATPASATVLANE